jgi:hypothetical protein
LRPAGALLELADGASDHGRAGLHGTGTEFDVGHGTHGVEVRGGV